MVKWDTAQFEQLIRFRNYTFQMIIFSTKNHDSLSTNNAVYHAVGVCQKSPKLSSQKYFKKTSWNTKNVDFDRYFGLSKQ